MNLYEEFKKLDDKAIYNKIKSYTENQQEEATDLDFKAGIEIKHLFDKEHRNRAKKELAKDLSAFSNAIGGVIIYGVSEKKNTQGRWLEIDPLNKNGLNIENINTIINSLTNPRIDNCIVKRIDIPDDENSCLVCIMIQDTQKGAIQAILSAKDFIYYKRFGTENRAIQHHDIQLINNKLVHPDIILDFKNVDFKVVIVERYITLDFHNIYVENVGIVLGKHVAISFNIPENLSFHNIANHYNDNYMSIGEKLMQKKDYGIFFPGFKQQMTYHRFNNINVPKYDSCCKKYEIIFRLYADSSPFKEYILEIDLSFLKGKLVEYGHTEINVKKEYITITDMQNR